MASYFISDLHLNSARPQLTAALQQFLASTLSPGDSLYILGDLFDVWVGDDALDDCSRQVAALLNQCSQRGISLFFIHGNRDFLLGSRFAQMAGMQLLAESTVIDLYGCPTLLMHGDSLCTQDLPYMAFRRKSRSWWWPRLVLLTPRWYRLKRAAAYRAHSQMAKQQKSAAIMDVTPQEVVRMMAEHGVQRLIHGHTHRPACHRVNLPQGQGWRWVLGEWHQSFSYLKVSATHCELLFAPCP